ncbi:ANR40 protein, partial [Amia calva]|nr:ANR40 protein [Amia calva]
MSSPSVEKELQERLREAAAIGDIDEVRSLVESGVNVNSQNEINGWTCLHWACKRNHIPIVAYLLSSGADKDVLTSKGEMAVQLTSKPGIRKILGVEEEEITESKEDDLPIIPNYLLNPPFPYIHTENPGIAQNGPLCSPLLSPNGNAGTSVATSSSRQQSIPQQLNCNQMGSMPAFQPFFFTSTFPMNMQELVLKVRIQNPSVRENDFIEVELDRQELTFRSLLRVCCRELGVSIDHVEKIRKLPNTILRKASISEHL